ncbi:MAG TPA: metallophosphoesterase [Rubrobacter sp.]|nr:metallophosphoesterase [Rubrobacter sp.]
MRKTVLLTASMAAAVLVACGAALLAADPGLGRTSTATMVGAGDIAGCSEREDSSATARLLGKIGGSVYTLGDNVQGQGDADEFKNCYDLTWGKHKKRTKPAVGNHEYHTAGAKPYFDYFGARAGSPRPGYYSYDLKSWHVVVLNSNCGQVGGCESGSRQGIWLKRDLRDNRSRCTVAYFHHPLQATGTNTPSPQVRPLWGMLHDRDADVILSGHAHRYERHAPMTPGGERSADGIRQFVVGTGGADGGTEIHENQTPNLQVVEGGTPGVLRLSLRADSYAWKFVPIAGKNFTDSGTDNCH